MRAADAFTESRAEVGVAHRRLYLPVVEQLADHGQVLSPSARARDANECLRSRMRTSFRSARARIDNGSRPGRK